MRTFEVMPDLGVLIAVLLSPSGAAAAIYDRWLRREFELVVAKRQLEQLSELLSRRAFRRDYVRPEEAQRFLHVLEQHARVVRRWSVGDLLRVQAPLPEVARHAGVDFLVTMETTHLQEDIGIAPVVLPPAVFLEFLDERREAKRAEVRSP
jgi:predicted nucleic acid-binding protein